MLATRYFTLSSADIAGGLGIGNDQATWLSTAYSIFEPIGVIAGCWLATAYGLRRVFLGGIVFYLFANALAFTHPTFENLLLARGMMGAAGGAIMPMAILIQLRLFGPEWRVVAIAIYACSTTMAPQLGGPIDAWTVEQFGWRSVFALAFVPGSFALLFGCYGLQKESARPRAITCAEVPSLIAIFLGLAALAFAVSQGDRLRWMQSPLIGELFAFSLVCVLLFLVLQWRTVGTPIVALALTGRVNFALGAIFTIPLQFANIFSGAILPSLLASVQGFRPPEIAPALATAFLPQLVSYAICIAFLRRKILETRGALVLGFVSIALGCLFDIPITSDWVTRHFAVGQVLQGLGLPFVIVPLLALFIGDVKPQEGIAAALIFNVARSISTTIATAWATTSLRLNGQAKFAELAANTGFYGIRGIRHETALAGIGSHLGSNETDAFYRHAQSFEIVTRAARKQAAVLGGAQTLSVLAALLFSSAILVLSMRQLGSGRPE